MAKQKKGNWKIYVGVFCLIGAVVMLFENFIASIVYAVIAFLMLYNGWQKPKNNSATVETAPLDAAPATTVEKSIEYTPDPEVSEAVAQTVASHIESSKGKNTSTPRVSLPSRPYTQKTYRITAEHYQDNILALASDNDDYNMSKREMIDAEMIEERVWKYHFLACKAKVVPEPDNPYDKNAIKVIVNGLLVGYIKQGSCAHLHKVIRENRIMGIDCTIGGGPYKEVYEEEYDYDRDKAVYTVEKGETKYSVTLTIYEANP